MTGGRGARRRPWPRRADATRVVVAVALSALAHLAGSRALASGARPRVAAAPARVVMALAAVPSEPRPAPTPSAPVSTPEPTPLPRPAASPRPLPRPPRAPPEPPAAAPPELSPSAPAAPERPGAGGSPGGDGPGSPGPERGDGSGGGPAGGGGPPPARPLPAPRRAPAPVAARELGERPRPPALAGELARRYPAEARRLGVSGEAAVRALIGPGGRVERADVARESRSGFGAACREALLASRWSPPRDQAGRAVATWVRYTCRFEVGRR